MRLKHLTLGAVGLIALMATTAKADIIPTLTGGMPTLITSGPNAGSYNWTYDISLTNSEALTATAPFAQFGTLYDIGYVPIVVASTTGFLSTDFLFSSTLTSTSAYLTSPADNPNLYNLNYLFDGTTTLVGTSTPSGTSDLDLGTLTIISTSDQVALTNYDGEATSACCGIRTGSEDGNVGSVTGPNTVPEPASLLLVGLGLIGVGELFRRSNKASQIS